MPGFLTGLVASGVKELVLGSVGTVVGGVRDVKLGQARAAVDTNKVNRETDRDKAVRSMATDERFGELQTTLALADRTDRRMAWVRPYFCALSGWYIGCWVLKATMPKVAAFLLIDPVDLPVLIQALIIGIPTAVLVLRPGEKSSRAETVATVHSNIVQAQQSRGLPKLLGRD